MNDVWIFAPVLLAGLALGTFFYGGLYWTVKKGLTSHYAGWWFATSLWLRLFIAAIGFYMVGQGDWKRFLVCFIGFVIARIAVTLLTKDPRHAA